MAAYLIAHAKVNKPELMAEYSSKAGPTILAHGGTVVTRGKVAEVLAGSHGGNIALIAKFPDAATAHAWYNSAEYQAVIPLRDQALEANFVVIEEA